MKKLLLLSIVLASTSVLEARQLTPAEALKRVTGSGITVSPSRSGSVTLAYTDYDNTTGENGVYVFSRGTDNGFLIVSADDCAEPLLGYSDDGTFDPDNMPDNFRAWLNSYTSQIAYASANETVASAEPTADRPYRAPIQPLCKTKWNQGFPFSNLCPVDENGSRSATGCVATAMAQILKYHNWPDRGVGSHSYVTKTLNRELSFDFGATTFDWDRMQNIYSANTSSNMMNNLAVATLMYACGVAGNMNYSPGGSGAEVKTALNGMIDYLKMDRGMSIQQRKWYSINDWEELIYNNLIDYGPIMYYGAANAYNAHEFVCDGYSKDGYFHINWGWGGTSDGYFLLTALNPSVQGIGGSDGGYNLLQNAVIGMCPAKESSHYAQLISSGTNLKGEGGNKTITVKGSFYNESLVPLDGVVFGVKIDDTFYPGTALNGSMPDGNGIDRYTVNFTDLAEGTYKVYPAYKTAIEDWQLMKCSYSTANYFEITVGANGDITVKNISSSINLAVSNMKLHTPLSPGKMFKLTATVENKGIFEFYDDIYIVMNGGDVPLKLSNSRVDLLPGSSEEVTLEAFLPTGVAARTYSMMLARANGTQNIAIGTPISVTVEESAAPKLYIVSGSIDNADAVDPENITVNLVVNNNGGYYFGPLAGWIFPEGMYALESPSFMIEAGAQNVHLSYTGSYPQAEPLKEYSLGMYYYVYGGDEYIYGASPKFTVRAESGIGEIDADAEVTAIAIYTATGVRIATPEGITDIESLATADIPAGIYILSLTHSDGHRSTMKYLKK